MEMDADIKKAEEKIEYLKRFTKQEKGHYMKELIASSLRFARTLGDCEQNMNG
jgi:hypothetical protein